MSDNAVPDWLERARIVLQQTDIMKSEKMYHTLTAMQAELGFSDSIELLLALITQSSIMALQIKLEVDYVHDLLDYCTARAKPLLDNPTNFHWLEVKKGN